MLTVKLRRHDNTERAISKLKNLMMKEGTLNALKAKRYFQKPSLKRRLKRENAARQRVKDLHRDIRAAQREEENFLQ
jgi:small subunit ribosomal protein S21